MQQQSRSNSIMFFKKINLTPITLPLKLRVVLIACLFLSSCALRQTPDGGPKDVTPPKILKSTPVNFSTNFKAKEIKIEFDEYIDLKDINKQLIISPLMPSDPEVKVKSKTLIIKLPDSLRTNTTYTLNFGNAIVDINEGIAYDDFQYVFSTGPVLDSLQVKGEVKFAENLKTEKGITVMLYNNASDTVVYRTLPDYFSKTDENGKFVIKNLRGGTYKMFALKDANGNYKFDSKAEAIGFADELITVPDTMQHFLKLFTEPDTIPHVLKAQYVSAYKVLLQFTAPVKDFIFKMMEPVTIKTENLVIEKKSHMDSVYVYCTDTMADSLNAIVFNGNVLIDTIHVNLKSIKAQKSKVEITREPLNISSNAGNGILESSSKLILYFDTPLKSFDTSTLQLTQDSITPIKFNAEQIDSLKKIFRINFIAHENKSYSLLIPAKAATDIFTNQNDSITLAFKTREEKEYAQIALAFRSSLSLGEGRGEDFYYIIQLLTDDDKVLRETIITKNQKVVFEYVPSGKYKIRLIDDANKNGKWDSGNYAHKTQPEKVFYYPESISTRANWDVDLSWSLK